MSLWPMRMLSLRTAPAQPRCRCQEQISAEGDNINICMNSVCTRSACNHPTYGLPIQASHLVALVTVR
jgi:hypothetical protein